LNRTRARSILEAVAAGELSPADALRRLSWTPADPQGVATVDHHRALRHGFPEVILAEGKRTDQVVAIAERIAAHGEGLLVTRADEDARVALLDRLPGAEANHLARTVHLPAEHPHDAEPRGTVLVVCAGTSDLPVAEEAAVTAAAFGNPVARLSDVGVAGLHRILAAEEALMTASVVIVVAGMEGALPSVVGGLVGVPVIAVPTSVGYGASFGGVAALLGMLNSCASGVTVVNIDNGFGAGCAAARINLRGVG
jgi:pyridinium-3,5-biscarboxylic acid mononucleotide synthase